MKKYLVYLLYLLFFSLLVPQNALACYACNRITTLEEGVLKVAVTGICKDNSPRHNCWVYKIVSTFAERNNLTLELIEVNFDQSWKLADANRVDIVATGITPLPQRIIGNASYSNIYTIVKRGIKIKREDSVRFTQISDFVGYNLAAVKGMVSEIDLRNRAIEGINIIAPASWQEVYYLFDNGEVAGIAEGFYFFPEEDSNEFNNDEKTIIIDIHDLEAGKIEGNTFVVRKKSRNLLSKLNAHIKMLGLPNHMP